MFEQAPTYNGFHYSLQYLPDLETTGEALNIDLLPTLEAHAVLSALHG